MDDGTVSRYDFLFDTALDMIENSNFFFERGMFQDAMKAYCDAIGIIAHNHSAEVLFRSHGLRRGRHTPPSIR